VRTFNYPPFPPPREHCSPHESPRDCAQQVGGDGRFSTGEDTPGGYPGRSFFFPRNGGGQTQRVGPAGDRECRPQQPIAASGSPTAAADHRPATKSVRALSFFLTV